MQKIKPSYDDLPNQMFSFGHCPKKTQCPNCLAPNVFLVYFFTKVVQVARIGVGEAGEQFKQCPKEQFLF